jgi:hypothetical protein
MIAASVAWLIVQRLLLKVRPLVVVLATATAAASVAALATSLRPAVGVATIAAGLGLLVVGGGPSGFMRIWRGTSAPRSD